jgi:carboxyl-terminal processing protease
MRNNPGGYLDTSVRIAGWFLKRGESVVIERFGDGREDKVYKADGNSLLASYPMVVLINQGSASAAEILAGALRDQRKIQLIGEQSFGKGSVQELQDLQKDASLKVTVAHWLTPAGNLISDIGLEPDIILELTEQDFENDTDPQLDKAIELLKNL